MKITFTDNAGLGAFSLEIDDKMLDNVNSNKSGMANAWYSPLHCQIEQPIKGIKSRREAESRIHIDGNEFRLEKMMREIANAVIKSRIKPARPNPNRKRRGKRK